VVERGGGGGEKSKRRTITGIDKRRKDVSAVSLEGEGRLWAGKVQGSGEGPGGGERGGRALGWRGSGGVVGCV